MPKEDEPILLSGGNPQIAKADGDEAVALYIAHMPGWKHFTGLELDSLIASAVPGVARAVRWNSPFYGVEGRGWFTSFHCFTHYVKLTFFAGADLTPPPSEQGKDDEVRYVHLREGDKIDEAKFTSWFQQAAKLPGWTGF